MKKQILDLIKNKPRHYSKMIQKNPELNEWVIKNSTITSTNFAEMVYNAIYSKTNICKNKKKMKFKSITVGYIGCGPASKCQCVAEQVQKSVTETKSKKTDDEKKQINLKRMQTNIERYGDANYNNPEAFKKTMMNRHGVEYFSQSDEWAQKTKKTNLEKFGTEWTFNDPEQIKKSEQTKLERYGDKHYSNPEKMKETKLEKYGDENFTNREKAKATNLKNHGVELYTNREKAKATNLKRYGSESFSNPEKTKQTKIERYGNESYVNPDQMKETKLEKYGDESFVNPDKVRETSEKRYNRSNPAQAHIESDVYDILKDQNLFENFVRGKSKALVTHELSVDFNTITAYVERYDCSDLLINGNSKWEDIIKDYLQELGIAYNQNTRKVIAPQELDFYLPDYNVAIELNGNYWHSEASVHNKKGKDKNYHYDKWLACREKGIDLYSYFEDELIDNLDVIKSKLKYLVDQNTTVVGARKCTIKDITYKDECNFLDIHHIQGSSSARNKTIGAYYNDKLIAVFSWLQREQYLEITRYCCDTNASYPGLFSKMMKRMINTLNYTGDIVSFSNNGHSNGGVYKASGFSQDKILGPAYWYTKDYILRENRQKYMKDKIAKRFDIDMTDKTEWQAMQELGYDRIWDCGKIKWLKTVK